MTPGAALDNHHLRPHARYMADSLKDRVREKIMRQRAEDGGRPVDDAEGDDPRLTDVQSDLALLDLAGDDDEVVQGLAAKYWVP
ncbi:Uncharacterised protein [Rhodococcus coprophilus]|uniref:Uncharacterized protein n=2 Tax=Rhodococcus coprophilus TaxID=38310 RepID=A0A2X4TYI8_9NOCA|nr:Uncharacterised protein [Rhodococcus coprophilus]